MTNLLITLMLALGASYNYWEESEVVGRLKAHVGEITLAQNEGRSPGSEGEKAAAEYLYNALLAKGVDMLYGPEGDRFGVVSPSSDTLQSRNVVGLIQGYDPQLRDHYIIIGARIDNIGMNYMTVDGRQVEQVYAGANGNASGMALMAELAGMLSTGSLMLRRSVILVGFGSSTASFAGSWHFLKHSFAKDVPNIDAMVNLDMLGLGRNGLQAFTSGNDDLNLLLNKVNISGVPLKATCVAMEPYPSDHQVFYASEIPSVFFTGGRYAEHNTPRDTQSILDFEFMELTLEYLYNFVVGLVNLPPEHPSFHKVAPSPDHVGYDAVPWSECDVPPAFSNNYDPAAFLSKWVYTYLKYPEACVKEGSQGRVMVSFVVTKEGKVADVKVTRSSGDPRLDDAAVAVVEISPKWRAARVKGQKVNCSITIPVEFKLRKRR